MRNHVIICATRPRGSEGMVVCAGWLTPNAHAQMHSASAMGRPTDVHVHVTSAHSSWRETRSSVKTRYTYLDLRLLDHDVSTVHSRR